MFDEQPDGDPHGECAAEIHRLRDVLIRAGFVECDIPACNCGSWHHRYGLPERMVEIHEVLREATKKMAAQHFNQESDLIAALKSYTQADEDGVMVKVSRQACDEAVERIAALEGLLRDVQRRIDAHVSRTFGLELLKRIDAAMKAAA